MRNKTRETEKSKRANFEFQINALFDIAQKDAVEIMQRQILYKDVSEDERIALREDIQGVPVLVCQTKLGDRDHRSKKILSKDPCPEMNRLASRRM